MAGLSTSDLFPPDDRWNDGPYARENGRPAKEIRLEPVAWYPYHDEQGRLLYEVVRTEPKSFFQQRPDGQGGWLRGLGETRRVIFRLPYILQHRPNRPILIVEGEKDVLALEQIDLLATCNPGGAGMGWRDEYSQSLAGRRCVVVPDNDTAGVRHGSIIVGSLMQHGAASVRIVRLPGLADGGDVSDWLAVPGNDRGELMRIVKATPEWKVSK